MTNKEFLNKQCELIADLRKLQRALSVTFDRAHEIERITAEGLSRVDRLLAQIRDEITNHGEESE